MGREFKKHQSIYFGALTSTGNYPASGPVRWNGGRGTFAAQATSFGAAGTIALQASFDGGTTFVGVGNALTANGFANFELPDCLLRVVVGANAVTAGKAFAATNDQV